MIKKWNNICFCFGSGHFLLTKLLMNKMVETAKRTGVEGRIVNVSSSIHGWFSGDFINYLGQISRNKWYPTFTNYVMSHNFSLTLYLVRNF